MEKRDKRMPYEVVIQERKRVDLYGNVVYYIHWFDKYGYNITNEWKFWISLFNNIINVTRYFNLWRMKPGKYAMVTNECGALDVIKEKFDNINIVEYGSE